MKNIQSKVEKTTLGDLGVLADLKKKMDNESNQEVAEAKAKKAEEPKADEADSKAGAEEEKA